MTAATVVAGRTLTGACGGVQHLASVGVDFGGDGFIFLNSIQPCDYLLDWTSSRHVYGLCTVAAVQEVWPDFVAIFRGMGRVQRPWDGLQVTLNQWGEVGGGGATTLRESE